MILKGIAATTQVDAHNTRIALEALESAAETVVNGKYVPSVGVEHDPTIIPIGKIVNAYVEKINDTDYGLYCEQDMFSIYPMEHDGVKFVMQKSLVDDRPLATSFLEQREKLLVQTDFVNFKSQEDAAAYLKELSDEYDIETGYCGRKSAIPDPELAFQFLEATVKGLFIYLASKPVIEKVGNHIIDHALSEFGGLYAFVKKAIISAAKRFVPANRPVTYVFTGKYEFVIELVVQTTNPNIAIEAICEEKLISVVSEIENLKKHFSSFVKIQLVYNTETGQWEFNYIATEKGEVIGTEKSYKKSLKKIELAFPENKDATKMAASIDFH